MDSDSENDDFSNFGIIDDLTHDSYAFDCFDNIFIVFKSIDDILYLIYTNSQGSIVSFNINDNKKMNEIRYAHSGDITNFRHYYDKKNSRDLVLSISCKDNNIKVWDIINLDLIVDFVCCTDSNSSYLYSACFLNDHNKIYIVSSNCKDYGISEPIKIFDFNGDKLMEINDSDDSVYFIDSFYDYEYKQNYIIAGNVNHISSYNYTSNELYHQYEESEAYSDSDSDPLPSDCHYSIIVHNYNNIIILIDSSFDGYIRIWDFHSADLLRKIQACDNWIYSICLWDDKYLCAASYEKKIILIDLVDGKVKENFNLPDEYSCPLTVKKINHPKYRKCLLIQRERESQIRIMGFKKNN